MMDVRIILAALSIGLSGMAGAEVLPPPQQLSAHSYAWIGPYGPPTAANRGFRMNLGFVVGAEAVAIIDSGYGTAMAEAMRVQIRQITDRPIRYVINTNSQPHRILGNSTFKQAGAEIVAAAEAVDRIVGDGAAMAATAESILGAAAGSISPPGPPDRALSETTELSLGDVTLRIVPVGTAHTRGSLIVEVVEDRVVYAGDVLYGGRLLAVLPVSRVATWLDAFDRLRAFDGVTFVPGHGEPGPLSAFEHSTSAYLDHLKKHMDAAVEQGIELQDAINALDQTPWQGLADFDALAGRNAHQTYLEREAAAFE